MQLYWTKNGLTIYCGDCLDVLAALPGGIAQTCVTSPPYWGLRDYGVDRQLGLERTPDCGMAGMIRLKKGLTEDQLQYVVRELLALASPCDAEHDKADKE